MSKIVLHLLNNLQAIKIRLAGRQKKNGKPQNPIPNILNFTCQPIFYILRETSANLLRVAF